MRKIKFRGLAKDMWKYGFVMNWAGNAQIWENTNEAHNYIVDEKTIGQFTGLKDKKGVEIFEGDILKVRVKDNEFIKVECFFSNNLASFYVKALKDYTSQEKFRHLYECAQINIEVIGNIHQITAPN